jgi:thioredoxin reductase (NADPH)
MSRAVVLAVDDDPVSLAHVERELTKRYGTDYEVRARSESSAALALLRDLRATALPVALVLADLEMSDGNGVELLAAAHEIHPTAKRALLVDWAEVSSSKTRIVDASTLGQIDCPVLKPVEAPDEQFHQVVTELLAEWATAQTARRGVVRVVGEQWSARCHEVRDLLARYGVPFSFVPSDSADGEDALAELGADIGSCPVLALEDGRVLLNPSNAEAADALGGNVDAVDGTFDVVVVGAGPAGLASAVYASSEGLRTLVVEGQAIGGQAGTTSRIRNYLGFPHGISGADFAVRAYRQASHFGTSFRLIRDAVHLRPGLEEHALALSDGSEVRARSIVVASGVAYRRLGEPSLERLVGRGVFYGPAVSEAPAMANQPVFVVGGGNSAGQAAVHLAAYASAVTVLVRGRSLAASMSAYLVREIEATPNISVRYATEAVRGLGEHRLEALVLSDHAHGREERAPAAGLFVLIGAEPRVEWLPLEVARCPRGYVITGSDLSDEGAGAVLSCHEWPSGRLPLETSVAGVFAVGDVRHRSVKRVASAAGEGAMVVALIHEHLARLGREPSVEPGPVERTGKPGLSALSGEGVQLLAVARSDHRSATPGRRLE